VAACGSGSVGAARWRSRRGGRARKVRMIRVAEFACVARGGCFGGTGCIQKVVTGMEGYIVRPNCRMSSML